MKKLPKQIYASLPSVSLYFKDIELIDEIFKNNCKSYTIVTEEYEFESLEELKQLESLTPISKKSTDSCLFIVHISC